MAGFCGGRIFPVVFLGGAAGLLAAAVLPGLAPEVGLAAGIAAAGIAAFRLPVFLVVFLSFFVSPGLVAVLVVAAVVSYTLVVDTPDLAAETQRQAGNGAG